MGQGTSIPKEPHIVVVGGGYGGIALCNELKSAHANFTLIDARDAFHHNVATVRVVAVPGSAHTSLIPYSNTFGTNFRHAKVTGVDPEGNKVHLEGGEDVSYDFLVLATGTNGPFPCKMGYYDRDEAIEKYNNYAEKVKNSSRIVAIGGGAVGVETVAEIATEYPDKKVTLIHGTDLLVMKNLNPAFHKKVNKGLKNLDVNVLTGEKVTNLDSFEDGPATVYTDKDSTVEADLVIRCTGLTVNKDAYENGLGHVLDARGALKVRKTFQVEGHDNIFAMGDCCASGDAWVAFLAERHAAIVSQNIAKIHKGTKLVQYKGHDFPFKLGLSFGRHHGFGELKNGMMLPDFVVKKIKAEDMLVGRYWKTMKQPKPK